MEERPRAQFSSARVISTLLLVVAAVALFAVLTGGGNGAAPQEVPITRVVNEVRAGNVEQITATGERLEVQLVGGEELVSQKEEGVSVAETLRQYGVEEQTLAQLTVDVQQPADFGWIWNLIWLLPLVFFIFLFASIRRRAGEGGMGDPGQAFSFAKSRARKTSVERPDVGFEDVAGIDEVKEELQEIVEFLKYPEKFAAVGARIPKGVLLAGPPGTGKTLLARAVAGEAGVPFFNQSASEFVELFVGVGASRVRDLFKQAKENAPSIVFIDEIDAIGRRRGSGMGQSHEEREQTLNQILAELDGFDPRTNVIIMAATNRPDVLDPALLRPGRFDRRIRLDSPDLDSREAILRVHARGKPLEQGVDVNKLARLTPGFSGADLENLLNEAALLAARRSKRSIGMPEMEEAIDRVVIGPQRRGRRLSPEEKEITAQHEAGHALVAHLLPNAPPVHKISIVSRGGSGGHTRVLPEEERNLWTRTQLEDMLAYTLGGMAAEELVYGETTTGPGSDLEQATRMARRMVTEYGMSQRLGPVSFGREDDGAAMYFEPRRDFSEQTAAQVDAEVRRLVSTALERATALLDQHRDHLSRLAEELCERETLQGEDLERALGPRRKAA